MAANSYSQKNSIVLIVNEDTYSIQLDQFKRGFLQIDSNCIEKHYIWQLESPDP